MLCRVASVIWTVHGDSGHLERAQFGSQLMLVPSASTHLYCRTNETNRLYVVVDAMQGQIMYRFAVNSGQIVNLFPCAKEPLLGALVVLDEVCPPQNQLKRASLYSTCWLVVRLELFGGQSASCSATFFDFA